MTVEKSEVLHLAGRLASRYDLHYTERARAADLMRSLHAENERLQQALRGAQLGSRANFASMQQQAAFKTNLLTALETIMDADPDAEFAAQAMKGVAREAVRAYQEATK